MLTSIPTNILTDISRIMFDQMDAWVPCGPLKLTYKINHHREQGSSNASLSKESQRLKQPAMPHAGEICRQTVDSLRDATDPYKTFEICRGGVDFPNQWGMLFHGGRPGMLDIQHTGEHRNFECPAGYLWRRKLLYKY